MSPKGNPHIKMFSTFSGVSVLS